MKEIAIILETVEKTNILGMALGKICEAGNVIALDGDLGAGKTTLTQAISMGLGVDKGYHVTSPSYNIFHEYPGRLTLYHMDFYRLQNSDDVIDMGLDEYIHMQGVTVIEWAAKASDILPDTTLSILLQNRGLPGRVAICSYHHPYWNERLAALRTILAKLK